jgi:hypothetical protein
VTAEYSKVRFTRGFPMKNEVIFFEFQFDFPCSFENLWLWIKVKIWIRSGAPELGVT